MSVRVMIADDHEIVRQGLRSLLEKHADIEVVAEASDGRQAVELARKHAPNVIIMDITMPQMNGIEATRRILGDSHDARIIALSMHSGRRFMTEVLKAGAKGYLLKECAVAELMVAIRAVISGRTYLSPRITDVVVDDFVRHVPSTSTPGFTGLTAREREVLQLIAEGVSTKEIAIKLDVSAKTIEAHRAQIMQKLQIFTVAGLTKFAIQEGLTSLES
jgi:DNA-binding NarL/FixJ family response regulator